MEQCPDDALFTVLDAESNSIAIIVKHMAGNMRSRWTDFLTSDGEKPDRNRDTEFESPPKTRTDLLEMWERGWKYVFGALEPLSDEDLKRTITIRTEPHSVTQAINRQVAHYSYHVWRGTSQAIDGRRSPSRRRSQPSSTGRLPPARSRNGEGQICHTLLGRKEREHDGATDRRRSFGRRNPPGDSWHRF